MPSRKVADAHIQFSAEGIPALTSAVKKLHGDLSSLSATAGVGGLFGTNFAKDIAQLDKVQRALKRNIQLKNQLMATEVQASLAADRTLASRSAQDRARGRIAQAGVRQVMVSPTLQKTQKDSSTLDFRELVKQRAETRKLINDPNSPVSGQFRKKADTVAGLRQNPTALRRSADEIRNALNSIKGFGPAGSKTKAAVDEVKQRMRAMADGADALAERMENLDRIIKKGAALTPEQRGRIRGNTRDELRSGERVDAITQRQATREEQSLSGRTLLNRRFSEIAETPDLTDRQKSNEQALAAKEVASTLRALAQDIRESKVDEALRNAANKLRAGEITPGAFLSEATKAEARQTGVQSAGSIAEDVNFRSKTGGASKDTVAMRQEAETLRSSKEEIDKLIAANSNLTAEEKKRLAVESELLAAEIKSSESRASISEEMDKVQAATKKAMGIEREFQDRVDKGEKLSKKDTAARKANKREIDNQARSYQNLNKKMGGFNSDMHAAAGSSRRFNFMLQQASFGVQDFFQVIGQTGLSGALRASANNMASVAAATGKVGGALTGALGTIAMIGFATALEKMGGEAETAAEKVEKINKKLEINQRLLVKSNELTGKVSAQGFSTGDVGLSSFRQSSREAEDLRTERIGLSRRADVQGSRLLGGGNTLTGEESARRALANDPGNEELRDIVDSINSNEKEIAAANARAKRSLDSYQRSLREYVVETNKRIEDGEDIVDSAFSQLRMDATSLMSDINASRVRLLDAPDEESANQAREILRKQEEALSATTAAIANLSNDPAQSRESAFTPVESLYGTIQQSISGDTEKSLSEKRNELLEEIAGHTQESVTREKRPRAEQAKPEATREDRLNMFRGVGGGMMSVPPPQFQFGKPGDQTENSTERDNNLRRINQEKKKESEGVFDRMREIRGNRGKFGDPTTGGMMSVAPPQLPYSKAGQQTENSAVADSVRRNRLRDLLKPGVAPGSGVGSGLVAGSGHNATDQTENSTERSNNLRAVNERNQRERASRNIFTGQSTEASMLAARSQIQRGGYSDLLRRGGQNDASFFGARRGGTVSDSATQRRGVVDDSSTFGRRLSGSGSTVPTSAAEDARALQGTIPRETPDENRRRRVAERIATFGARPDAGPELNSRTVKTAIAAMPVAESRRAGPVATAEEAARFRAEREAKAGPVATAEEAARFKAEREAKAGPAFESTREAKSGPRSLMRRAQSAAKGAAARVARAKELADARSERLKTLDERDRIKSEAEEDLESRRTFDPKTGFPTATKKSPDRRRKRRAAAGKDPSFMQRFEAGEFDPAGSPAAVGSDSVPGSMQSNVNTDSAIQTSTVNGDLPGLNSLTEGTNAEQYQQSLDYINSLDDVSGTLENATNALENLQSNVNTDSSTQATAANDESLKYQQASSETLKEMLNFFKTRVDSGGLVIS